MLQDDKVFAIYSLGLICAVLAVLSLSVGLGLTQMPSPLEFVEHAGLGLIFRGMYKSLNGTSWVRDTLEYTGMIEAPKMQETLPA